MQEGKEESPFALMPWAAFVTGHHPHSLWLRLLELWEKIPSSNPRDREKARKTIAAEMRELARALNFLASGERIGTAVLADALGALRRFWGVVRKLIQEPWMVDPDQPAPGLIEWTLLVGSLTREVGLSGELGLWHQLGVVVGKLEHDLCLWFTAERDFLPEAVQKLTDLLERLDRPWSEAISAAVKTVREFGKPPARRKLVWYPWVAARRDDLVNLGRRLKSALRRPEFSEPLLILGDGTITLLGETRPLGDFPKSEMACLRVLAERPGKDIDRKTIKKEGRLQTSLKDLRCIISRLNLYLRKWLLEICQRCDWKLPAVFPDRLIEGKKTRGSLGPYRLCLAPHQVKVSGPRPDWMKPAYRLFGKAGQL
jgi:hypothetical protein